jgi:pyruvate,water dikinase
VSYLLLQAVALVTEHGGALSHAATLAREYGVPAVVGVPGALRAITHGEELEVDGTAGTVTRLDAPPHGPPV